MRVNFPEARTSLTHCIGESPQYTELVLDVSTYVSELRQNAASSTTDNEPVSKKRKLGGPSGSGEATSTGEKGAWDDPGAQPVYEAPGVSFGIPQRSKLSLQVIGGRHGGIRAVNPAGNTGSPWEFGLAWRDMDQVFCLPVPEKAKRAWNYIVIPYGDDGIGEPDGAAPVQVLWTYNELSAKEAAASTAPAEPDHTLTLLEKHLAPFRKTVTTPNDDEFASAVPQSHRKGEKAYHVKAFRGSKEGFLFFLSTGILWGFKKPVAFFAFARIESISYTSVLQRTFNLVIATNPRGEADANQEIEFSMLDQQDFAGIDAYVKGHGLNDASLAKQRAAKLYNVNKDKGAKAEVGPEANGGIKAEEEDDGLTEIQRAEQQIQDEEDEMEEDYDPGSEGESEGEGSSEDEGYEEGEGGGGGGDEVEAEEVEEGEQEAGEGDEGDEEEEYDEEDPAVEEAVVPPQPTTGFAVINGFGRPPPEEPEDGFL